MKNKFMQTVGGTFLALLTLVGATQIFVSAQNLSRENPDASFTSSDGARNSIEGVWQTTITLRNCGTGAAIRTFRGLSTFTPGAQLAKPQTL